MAAGTRPPLWSWSQQRGWGSGCSMQAGARPGKVPNVPLGAGPRGSRLTEGTPTPARPTCGSPPFSQTCPGLHTSGDPGAVPVKMLLLCPWSSGDSGLASHTPRWALSQLRHASLGRRRLVPILSETDQTPCSQDRPRPTCHRTPSTLTRPPRATGGPQGRTGLGEKTPSRAWSLGSCDVLPRPSCCRPHLPDSGPTAPGPLHVLRPSLGAVLGAHLRGPCTAAGDLSVFCTRNVSPRGGTTGQPAVDQVGGARTAGLRPI